MTELNQIVVDHAGNTRSAGAYGDDYLSELHRIISTYAPARRRNLLEWGMGNTTLFFLQQKDHLNLGTIVSLDHEPSYFASLVATLPQHPDFSAHLVDLMGPKLSNCDPELNYSSFPISLGVSFDIFYIDGRRRMECALTAAQICKPDSLIILHDYRRGRYQSVDFLFETLEAGSQFRVMRPRTEILRKC